MQKQICIPSYTGYYLKLYRFASAPFIYIDNFFRFDLVLTLLDSRNPEWDKMVSSYILNIKDEASQDSSQFSQWPIVKLQAYFNYIRTLKPQLSLAANRILSKYYQRQRQTDGADVARTTVRLLQSCVRLAQVWMSLQGVSEKAPAKEKLNN